ncbi:type I-F CRISPR-associated protein Cas7f/Csy3, partial [Acinetobacter baumannii]|nr:type I-F CRISPR-associated protein Cas7f/Csy3 [Acinetobacter baumannii]
VRNIVNGRWLWRNRIVAESITIQVTAQDHPETLSFDALSYNLKSFDQPSEQEQKLADILLKGITGESTSAALHIEAIVDFGMGGVEVFPS